jgi:hypothetical protein
VKLPEFLYSLVNVNAHSSNFHDRLAYIQIPSRLLTKLSRDEVFESIRTHIIGYANESVSSVRAKVLEFALLSRSTSRWTDRRRSRGGSAT